MAKQIIERCIYCHGDVRFEGTATLVKCASCGKTFAVAQFQSEQIRIEEALKAGEKAKAALAKAEADRDKAQRRLNDAVRALEDIDLSQQELEARLDGLFRQTKADRQVRANIEGLLDALKSGQEEGRDALTRLMLTLAASQSSAGDKLELLGATSQRLLDAQGDIMSQLKAQTEIVQLLNGMRMDADERQKLQSDFILWSQQMHEEDAARLRQIQSCASTLVEGQRALNDNVSALRETADATLRTLEGFRTEYREDKLAALETLYHQAENFQMDRAFDKAADAYRKMLVNGSSDTEVYWRLVLCHYCVEYQRDDEGNLIPIILNPDLRDPEELSVRRDLIANVGPGQSFYLEELARIDAILDRYREVRHQVRYDVFIGVKQRENGHVTIDSDKASDLYDFLTGLGLKVFNSRRTHIPAGQEYEPYIISALMSARVLIVVGGSAEHMNAQWVRNEWSRFQWLQANEKEKTGKTDRVLFCYLVNGMRPADIPKALNPNRQAIVEGVSATENLREALRFLLPQKPVDPPPKPPEKEESLADVLNQMTVWLYNGQYQKVSDRYGQLVEKGLYIDSARLHMAALCAERRVRDVEQLVQSPSPLEQENLFRLAMKVCGVTDRVWLDELRTRNAAYIEGLKKKRPKQVWGLGLATAAFTFVILALMAIYLHIM